MEKHIVVPQFSQIQGEGLVRRKYLGLVVATLLTGCDPGRYGPITVTNHESRMVEAGLATDITTANTMIVQYRTYIDNTLAIDNQGLLWSGILRKYGHDELTIFRFLRREGFFPIDSSDYPFYKILLSREAHNKGRG